MDRRQALTLIGTGGAGYAISTGFTAPGCSTKDLSMYTLIIARSYGEIKPLLPELGLSAARAQTVGNWIDKAISISGKFDEAYKRGAFADAASLFNELGSLVMSIAGELNVANNRIVTATLAGVAIARIAIAALLAAQAQEQGISSRTARQTPAMSIAITEIERLNAIDLNQLVFALQ